MFDSVGASRPSITLAYSATRCSLRSAALSGKASEKKGFQFPEGLVHHVSEANGCRMPDGVDDEASYCDFLVDEFERKLAELGAENVACFFAEPIMGAGGVLVAPEGYHRRMKEVCEANDILYVSDEVVTAFGRLGHFFSTRDRFEVMPDMIVTAKGITSGYLPLAATLLSDRVYDAIEDTTAELDREGLDFAAQADSLGPENGTRPPGSGPSPPIAHGALRLRGRTASPHQPATQGREAHESSRERPGVRLAHEVGEEPPLGAATD